MGHAHQGHAVTDEEEADLEAKLDIARNQLEDPMNNGCAYATSLCLYVIARRLCDDLNDTSDGT